MLPTCFYQRPDVIQVAKDLLGKSLFTKIEGQLTGGIITETEAYAGVTDRASHAYGDRRTPRTEVMYLPGGIAYVYLCYGIHCLLNAVTSVEGTPHAVLIRALKPTHGIDIMLQRRKKKALDATLTAGPGSLTAALGITLKHNGLSLASKALWIADSGKAPEEILTGPRIGIDYAGKDALLPYRFRIAK